MFEFLGNFLNRLMIYQIIIIWIALKYLNPQKYSNEFKDKINTNLSFFEIKNNNLDDLLLDPETFTKYFTVFELLFAVLAIFGFKTGSFFSGIVYLFTTFIYFNPLLPENKIQAFYGVKMEFLFSLGVILAIFLDTFAVSVDNKYVESEERVVEEEDKKLRVKKKKGK